MTGTRRLVPLVARAAAAAAAAAAARSARQLETPVTRTGLGADGALERQRFAAALGALAVAVAALAEAAASGGQQILASASWQLQHLLLTMNALLLFYQPPHPCRIHSCARPHSYHEARILKRP